MVILALSVLIAGSARLLPLALPAASDPPSREAPTSDAGAAPQRAGTPPGADADRGALVRETSYHRALSVRLDAAMACLDGEPWRVLLCGPRHLGAIAEYNCNCEVGLHARVAASDPDLGVPADGILEPAVCEILYGDPLRGPPCYAPERALMVRTGGE